VCRITGNLGTGPTIRRFSSISHLRAQPTKPLEAFLADFGNVAFLYRKFAFLGVRSCKTALSISMAWPRVNAAAGQHVLICGFCGYRGYLLAKLPKNSEAPQGLPPFDTLESRNRTRSEVPLTPANQIAVRCPRCDRTFRLNYPDDEWHCVKTLLCAAERVLREDHKKRHEMPVLELKWNPVRGG
jgi:hypothetical protein